MVFSDTDPGTFDSAVTKINATATAFSEYIA